MHFISHYWILRYDFLSYITHLLQSFYLKFIYSFVFQIRLFTINSYSLTFIIFQYIFIIEIKKYFYYDFIIAFLVRKGIFL
jgi:hypothetical protein